MERVKIEDISYVSKHNNKDRLLRGVIDDKIHLRKIENESYSQIQKILTVR